MAHSNLSIHAKCFVPSKESDQNIPSVPKPNHGQHVNYFNQPTSYLSQWYPVVQDAQFSFSTFSSTPYNNLYSTSQFYGNPNLNERFNKTRFSRPSKQSNNQNNFLSSPKNIHMSSNNKNDSRQQQQQHSKELKVKILPRNDDTTKQNKEEKASNTLNERTSDDEGRIIIPKKKKKAKNKNLAMAKEDETGQKSKLEVVAVSSSVLSPPPRDESLVKEEIVARSYSAVVRSKPNLLSSSLTIQIPQVQNENNQTHLPSGSTKLVKTKNKEIPTKNKKNSNDFQEKVCEGNKNLQRISKIPKTPRQEVQRIKILQRNENIEDVLKILGESSHQASTKKISKQENRTRFEKTSQKKRPQRTRSSDVPQTKKQEKSTKLSEKPITLNIFEMISMSKKAQEGPTAVTKMNKNVVHKRGPNLLDSTAVVKRGKERESPKEKRPTKLRKVILRDRMLRRSKFLQSLGLLETRSLERLNEECNIPLVVEDDVTKLAFPAYTSALDHLQNVDPRVLSSLHSRRFREYCNQVLSKEIDECCVTFLKELVRFQDNQYHKDPLKARSKRRLVYGLREVLKYLGVRKMKCVVISPNVEKVQSEGGLEEKIERIILLCQENNIPFVFALSRRQLGSTCLKKVPVSVVGILNYEGAQTHFQRLKELTESAREKYDEMVSKLTEELSSLDIGREDDNVGLDCMLEILSKHVNDRASHNEEDGNDDDDNNNDGDACYNLHVD